MGEDMSTPPTNTDALQFEKASEPTSTVIVTGGASGIGRACAMALAAAGRPVAVWDLDHERSVATAADIAAATGVATWGAGVDVAAVAGLPDAVAAAGAALGPVGGLVHAAGIVRVSSLDDLTEELWDAVVGVQQRAIPFLVQAVANDLRATPGSAVVLIGSLASFIGYADIASYVASKAAVLGLTRSLALALAADGVRVNAVCPGYIETGMLTGSPRLVDETPLGRMGRPEDIARAARFLLSADASFITGTQLVVDGGVLAGRP
jgi:NAD(P)-dependent dehydrogenase (short-subunit alcohol dehydrogenase family)